MNSESDGFYGKLVIGDKAIDVWGSTLEELNRLIAYYKEEHLEFENEWKKQNAVKSQ